MSKIDITFEADADDIKFVLDQLEAKIEKVISILWFSELAFQVHTNQMAPEAADQIRDRNGNVIGTIKVR